MEDRYRVGKAKTARHKYSVPDIIKGDFNMILCIDIGNTLIYGGLFKEGKLCLDFHRVSNETISPDELGLFLTAILRENGYSPSEITDIGFCSVVPELIHVMLICCRRYFDIEPFQLQAGVKAGLSIRYSQPKEVGSDRIANAIAAVNLYPERNIIIFDFGTATTVCAVSASSEYLGGVLLPGIRIAMEAMSKRTARLPEVEIVKPGKVCGKSTVEGIQSGLYYSNLGMIKEFKKQFITELFPESNPVTVATGAYAELFKMDDVFNALIPDLVLLGVYQSLVLNRNEEKNRWKKKSTGQSGSLRDGGQI